MSTTPTLRHRVMPEEQGRRLDRVLAAAWPELTRSRIQALIEAGHVTLDGRAAKSSVPVKEGAEIVALLPAAQASSLTPEAIPLSIVHEDEDVLVIDKPAGLVVHPGAGHPTGTLVGGLLARFDLDGVGDPARPGIVHRLDRDTSGLLVVARTAVAYAALVRDLAAHDVRRRYTAVVHGIPSSARGTIDAPIGRSPRWPTRMAVRTGGREARTHYEVVEAFDDVARLAVELETGRTHQIRVHLAAIEHPVLGDSVYGSTDVRLARPFLHAANLAFTHPVTGVPMEFSSPLPPELAAVLSGLGAPRPASPSD